MLFISSIAALALAEDASNPRFLGGEEQRRLLLTQEEIKIDWDNKKIFAQKMKESRWKINEAKQDEQVKHDEKRRNQMPLLKKKQTEYLNPNEVISYGDLTRLVAVEEQLLILEKEDKLMELKARLISKEQLDALTKLEYKLATMKQTVDLISKEDLVLKTEGKKSPASKKSQGPKTSSSSKSRTNGSPPPPPTHLNLRRKPASQPAEPKSTS